MAAWGNLIVKQDAARQAFSAQQEAEARRIELVKAEAAQTFQQVVLEFALVTFGAGATVQNILTGFETCQIRVKNLPSDANYKEVCALFAQQGIESWRFHVVGLNKMSNGKQEATIICQDDLKSIAVGLDGIEFRQEHLLFELPGNSSVRGMRSSLGNDSNLLTISWRAPSVGFVATYSDVPQAQAKVRELDGRICAGRRVKVEINRPPPGQFVKYAPSNTQVVIKGLPPDVTDAEVSQFSTSAQIRRLKPIQFDAAQAPGRLRNEITSLTQGQLELFETVSTNTIDGKSIVRAHFGCRDTAKRVYDFLDKQRFWYIGDASFWLRLPDPLQYTITIPARQYLAQKKRWDKLLEGVKDQVGCNMWVNAKDKVYLVRVAGEDKKAVGSLKVRVENLAAGERLEHWHRFLGTGAQQFLDSVFNTTGAYIRNDWRLRAVKAYGEQRSIDAARTMVESEVKRLESLEQTVFLKRQSVGFFVRRGLAELQEELGKDNVMLDTSSSPCKITIKGSELARHALSRLIDESLNHSSIRTDAETDSNCPICYDTISSPVQLGCGHNYCTACIRHFLSTASETKSFPLCCMGNENNCHIPIPLPTLQKFLTVQQFEQLLESSFVTHIKQLPQEFKYCTTPDCNQVHRCNSSSASSVIHCPSCLSAVCSTCHEEAHEGLTCAERKLHSDPVEQERLNDQLAMQVGYKKCPRCDIWIEKIDGCNHMSCRCGVHICWVCIGVFTAETIYEHLHTAHGGIHGPAGVQNQNRAQVPPVGEAQGAEDQYLVQVELLRQANQRRQQEQEREQRRREELRRQQEVQVRLVRQEQIQQEATRRLQALRRQDALRFAEATRMEADARRQEIHHREERARKESGGWGCVVM
jgi:hypothetical protein